LLNNALNLPVSEKNDAIEVKSIIEDVSRKLDSDSIQKFNEYSEDENKDDIFKEKLGRISIKELARTAKDRRSGSLGFAEAILIGYNKKCRNPLPWDKLYTHKLPQKKADETEQEEETDDMPQNGQLDLFGLDDEEEVSE